MTEADTTLPTPGMPLEKHRSEIRSCPCCGSTELAAWAMHGPRRAEEMSFADLQSSWAGFFKEKAFFTYRKCAECGLVYSPSYFTEEQIQELYASMDDNTAGVDAAMLARTQRSYYETIKRLADLSGGGDFLELGPDIGAFTQPIVEHERFGRHWLIEPNVRVHEALAKVCAGKDFQIATGTDEIERIPDGSLGLVVMIHVLDHLLDPLELLRKVHRKMRPGGVLAAVTHDQSSLIAQVFGRRWPAYCLQHPQLYSPATASRLMEKAGFARAQVVKTHNFFPFNYLVKHFLFAAGLGRWRLDFLPDFALRIQLGNIETVGLKP